MRTDLRIQPILPIKQKLVVTLYETTMINRIITNNATIIIILYYRIKNKSQLDRNLFPIIL